jgi:hypothetical protein
MMAKKINIFNLTIKYLQLSSSRKFDTFSDFHYHFHYRFIWFAMKNDLQSDVCQLFRYTHLNPENVFKKYEAF